MPVMSTITMDMGKDSLRNNALKDRTGKKEPQNSFFNHESVFLKGLNKMFERRNRHGKNVLK